MKILLSSERKSSLESINGSTSLYYQVKKVENSSAGGGFRTHDLQIMSITLYVDWHSRPGWATPAQITRTVFMQLNDSKE